MPSWSASLLTVLLLRAFGEGVVRHGSDQARRSVNVRINPQVFAVSSAMLSISTPTARPPLPPNPGVTRPQIQECPAGFWLKYECAGWSILGGSNLGSSGDQEGTSSLFNSPSGVSVSPDGSTVFVTDPGNQRWEETKLTVRRLWQITVARAQLWLESRTKRNQAIHS
jgi:DNA-binding beta-propeller fold protein YncE